MLDELNKYAPREGTSPIKELLVDIAAARPQSLGVLLIGAQQSARGRRPQRSSATPRSRSSAGSTPARRAEYRFLTPELRERAARFLPGTMVLDQPLIPAPIPLRFPFPPFATNVAEAAGRDPQLKRSTPIDGDCGCSGGAD